ncbi:ubiquinol-cytochrome C chaperone family protein [uncultured Selenomonas sp.]|uniref:YaaW family protein n=1 Tax=uncultured Selenomonas sp. TaxID=159275 RepID=UPI0028EB3267|nr:ubiquinol-cytochrome C chaperone family protein [uncultured Selenomonas sp.]
MDGFEVLDEFSNEELEVLVKLILDKGALTETLTGDEEYEKYKPNHKLYVNRIKKELSDFAANSFARMFRGHGVSYREMLIDVCKKTKTPFNEKSSLERIENALLEKVLEDTWENLSAQEKEDLFKDTPMGDIGGMGAGALIGIFRAGGFASYQLTLVVVNAIAKAILGRGLPLVANAALARALGILTGPLGIALTALWTAIDIAGPAYRVTVPATIYIAALRRVHQSDQYKEFAFQ